MTLLKMAYNGINCIYTAHTFPCYNTFCREVMFLYKNNQNKYITAKHLYFVLLMKGFRLWEKLKLQVSSWG